MITVLSTNITSPIGLTTERNYRAVRSGSSALARYDSWKGIPVPFAASLFTDAQMEDLSVDGCTRFESLAIRSVGEALERADVDLASPRTLFILSTTKAEVGELEQGGAYLAPGEAAGKIAEHFGIATQPVVVCNACVSGVTAQMLALRMIESGEYDTAIVCGVDCQTPFIISGFMSFKAVSSQPCRPFDIERLGLNLGEAAATMIFSNKEDGGDWHLVKGCLNNDAYHLSAPSPVGEGTCNAIRSVMEGHSADELATICVHGTSTMFNDQMESVAIEKTGLSDVPLTALKGYYGHTMGAAGVVETILTMRGLDDGCVLPVKGYDEIGVSGKVNISNREVHTDKRSFLKVISGFGGCNGALLYTKDQVPSEPLSRQSLRVNHSVRLTESSLMIDGELQQTSAEGKQLLTELYKSRIGDYPKFYKMDTLSKVVSVAAELLIRSAGEENAPADRAVILFNRTSSIVADLNHIATISDKENFYPSPSVFLYTLPNIVTGEIAIKHGYKGETTLYIMDSRNGELMDKIVAMSGAGSVITGWVDCPDENIFEADLKLMSV